MSALQLASLPLLAAIGFCLIVVLQSAIRIERGSSTPHGPERWSGELLMRCERLGQRRWRDGRPRQTWVSHHTLTRLISLIVCGLLLAAWVAPHLHSIDQMIGASILALLAYGMSTGLGAMLAYLVLVIGGWERVSGEDGGGGQRSQYYPKSPSGPRSWQVREPSRSWH